MSQTVIGIFNTASDAEKAVERLLSANFTLDHVDVANNTSSTTSSTTEDEKDVSTSKVGRFFQSLFGSSDEATAYSEVARRGKSLVTVHAQSQDDAMRAAEILDSCGAIDVNEQAAEYGISDRMETRNTGSYESDSEETRTDSEENRTDSEENRSIPVIEEQLRVGKETVETGGARLRSRIVERPVEENLRLREERVTVERNTVDRPATDADLTSFQEGEIEMIERSEVPRVSKEARVVEEITLGKEVEEREETISDTVRRTEVDIENLSKDELTRKSGKKKGK
jgi:uncharacterized protein (TIGR02271 family)